MSFRPAIFLLTATTVSLLTTGPVAAQRAIQFSKPTDSGVAKKANAFIPKDDGRKIGGDNLKAPQDLFNLTPVMPMPAPQRPLQPGKDTTMQSELQKNKKWMLMSPEEIMGVPMMEKGYDTKDAREEKMTLEERFLFRQGQSSSNSAVAARLFGKERDSEDNPLLQRDRSERAFNQSIWETPDSKKSGNPFLAPNQQGGLFGSPEIQRPSAWTSVFAQPTPTTTHQNTEHVAAMNRFRELIDPPRAEKSAAATRWTSPAFAPNPQSSSLLTPPIRSATPIRNDISRVKPLTGITGPNTGSTPPKSSSLTELPPWMKDKNGPQRRY